MIDLRKIVHSKAKKETKKSWAWYEQNVRNAAAGMSAKRFFNDNRAFQTKNIQPGMMISFFYDPKTKEKLPYYDTFPMVLPFSANETHFTGLNLHYISPISRAVLLNKLLQYASDDSLRPGTKLKITWELLKTTSMMPQIAPCVKQYLFKHVKSNFIVIPPKEYEFVIFLPLERFEKASNETVWSKSGA